MINIDEYIKQAIKTQDKDKLRAYKNLKANIQLIKTAKMQNLILKIPRLN